jgi:hypothetical protein
MPIKLAQHEDFDGNQTTSLRRNVLISFLSLRPYRMGFTTGLCQKKPTAVFFVPAPRLNRPDVLVFVNGNSLIRRLDLWTLAAIAATVLLKRAPSPRQGRHRESPPAKLPGSPYCVLYSRIVFFDSKSLTLCTRR